MDAIFRECDHISHVFESMYVNKSVVVCNNPSNMFHLQIILSQQLFPVETLCHENFTETINRFNQGHIRMMIMSELIFYVLTKYRPDVLEHVNVIFKSGKSQLIGNYQHGDKKIISLCE